MDHLIDPPEITQSEATKTAFVHVTVPREQIRLVVDPALRELRMALAGQGIKPTGPWFTHHLKFDPKVFDFRVCLPIAKDFTPTGRVQPGQMDGRKIARTIYRGPYENLGAAWGVFGTWLKDRGHTPEEDFWARYLRGSEKSDDPAEWETELNRPLAR